MTDKKVDTNNLTPMMKQYVEIKKQAQDCLLFYRLGDFYELFYEDAVVASKLLGLVLTKKIDVPMCGVPWHAYEMYLTKLIQNGYRVAICEQTETPEEAKSRGAKGPVNRKITRIVSRGTLIEQSMLSEKNNNFLLAITSSKSKDKKLAIAYADVSTGRFLVEEIEEKFLLSVITKISPVEILCNDQLLSKKEILEGLDKYKSMIRAIPSAKFMNESSQERLLKFFNVKFIDSFGNFSMEIIDAASAIIDYILEVYKDGNVKLLPPKLIICDKHLQIDSFTRRSLELEISQFGEKKDSLLANIDLTQTAQGARMLARWLMQPLCDQIKINKRLDFVDFFVKNQKILNYLRDILKNFPDLERTISRLVMEKAGPRDLRGILLALEKALELNVIVSNIPYLLDFKFDNQFVKEIIETLNSAIIENPPLLARDGGFIKKGYDSELDEYLNLITNGEYILHGLQKEYINQTSINSLKIKNNGVLGYFIEVSPNFASKIPYNFIHRQTLASSMRYTTQELSDIANKIYSADSSSKRREQYLLAEILKKITIRTDIIRKLSDNIAFLDVITAFAELAIQKNYIRPLFSKEKIIDIEDGRHPVVENNLQKAGETFTCNNCYLDKTKTTALLTGPNMGGKSTFLRQNAIIIIMAQIGSFVPAKKAEIGMVDKIFSRVGAFDDISTGKSTFMVEMLECSAILNQATENSFIILDEIGRGTSTYDGLAIAWAVLDEIANNIKARTIFATHYHELKSVKDSVPAVEFYNVKVEEWNDKIIFLHKIEKGFADKSYGIHVASLAGFPEKVLKKAREVLKTLS